MTALATAVLAATATALGVRCWFGPPIPRSPLDQPPGHAPTNVPGHPPASRRARVDRRSAAGRLERLGRRLTRLTGRRPHPRTDAAVGAGVLVVVGLLIAGPGITVSLAGALGLRHWWHGRRRSAPADRALVDAIPDLTDLLAMTTAAGLTVPASLPLASRWAPSALRPGLADAASRLRSGASPQAAWRDATAAWGDAGRPLAHALDDHLRHGTPLGPSLRQVGAEARAARRRAAETRARRLPVLLLLPLVLCTLPAFGLLTVAPIVAGTLRSLDQGRLEAPASHHTPIPEVPCSSSVSSTPSPAPPTPLVITSGDRCRVGPASSASRPPSTHSSSSAPPPSPSCSSPGPARPAASAACSTPSSTP